MDWTPKSLTEEAREYRLKAIAEINQLVPELFYDDDGVSLDVLRQIRLIMTFYQYSPNDIEFRLKED